MASPNELQTYDVGNGTVVTVAWMLDDFTPVAPEEATMAKLVFSDGEMAIFRVNRDVKALGGPGSGNFGHAGRPGQVGGSFGYGRTRQGPPAVTLETAKKRGYTDGPFYHSTNFARAIEQKGFLSKGAEKWEISEPGYMEDFRKWGTASPVMFSRNIEDVVETDQHGAYGTEVITLYAKPGTVKSAAGMTLLGGLYVSDPTHVVPIKGSRKSAIKTLAAHREGPLHRAADAHTAKLSVVFRYAFAKARKALGRETPNVDAAIEALREALQQTLPKTLMQVLKAGGEVGAGALRTAAFNPDQPRDEQGRWTDEGGLSTSTSEFKAWFEGSKVIDKDGEPKKVYHRGNFDERDEIALEIGKEGMHFGTKDAADARPSGKTVDDAIRSIVIEKDEDTGRYHWSMDNIDSYDLNEEGFDDEADARADAERTASTMGENDEWNDDDIPLTEAYLNIRNPMRVADQAGDWVAAVAKAKALGHDGIIYINQYEDKGSTSYIVFSPMQVKSTKSKGFDPKNPLINLSGRFARDERRRGPFVMRFDTASPEAIAWADRHAAELIDGISETTREAIGNAVAEALETGDLRNMYDEILDAVGDEDRAELIARTEVMTAANEGQRQAWRQAVDAELLTGDERRTWLATGDEGVCPVCEELDGSTADLDGEYPEPGGAGPPAHPRCRCTEGLSYGRHAAGFDPNQPRDEEGQWTRRGAAERVIRQYVNGNARYMNAALRAEGKRQRGEPASDQYLLARPGERGGVNRENVYHMDRAINSNPLPADIEVFRTVPNIVLKDVRVGDVFQDDGYVSTTRDAAAIDHIRQDIGVNLPQYHSTLTILVPQGLGHLDVSSMSTSDQYLYQKEIILPRGLRFEVLEKGPNTMKVRVVR